MIEQKGSIQESNNLPSSQPASAPLLSAQVNKKTLKEGVAALRKAGLHNRKNCYALLASCNIGQEYDPEYTMHALTEMQRINLLNQNSYIALIQKGGHLARAVAELSYDKLLNQENYTQLQAHTEHMEDLRNALVELGDMNLLNQENYTKLLEHAKKHPKHIKYLAKKLYHLGYERSSLNQDSYNELLASCINVGSADDKQFADDQKEIKSLPVAVAPPLSQQNVEESESSIPAPLSLLDHRHSRNMHLLMAGPGNPQNHEEESIFSNKKARHEEPESASRPGIP